MDFGSEVEDDKGYLDELKGKDEEKKDTLRVILGEFGRLDKKELSDDEVVKILKKLIKSEKEMLEIKGVATDSRFISIEPNQ